MDWYKFGFALGISLKTLDEIEDKDGMRRYMLAMLKKWLGTGEATWEQLQVALVIIGNVRLSKSLEKYTGEQKQQQHPEQQPGQLRLQKVWIILITICIRKLWLVTAIVDVQLLSVCTKCC